jgi:hypothetical protein
MILEGRVKDGQKVKITAKDGGLAINGERIEAEAA